MADLNALIAQGYQFQPLPDPFAQYAKRQQLDLGEQTNQLNQMKMQEAQAAAVERNALRQFLPGLNESNRNQLLGYGATGQNIFKTMAEGDKERRLAEQAVSQTAVNKSNILKNAVAQTRDAVAGIDPNDAPSYMALRASVLSQYPDLEPYMPSTWNADTKQRLIVTAASVLEGQKPEPGFTLSPGQVRYPAGYTGVVTAPTAATKPPEKLEIMRALGYSMDAAGDAAYETAKRAPPTVAAPPAEISTMNALGIPVTPEGYAYLQQLKTKPVVTAEPTTNEIKNARAIALGAGPEGSAAYNQSLQTQLLRLTDKPVTAAAATSTEMKNADAFALLKGPAGSPAYNAEFAKQMARLTAKSEGAAATPAAPVAVVGTDGKVKYVSREEAISKGMTPASAMEGLAPKEIQNREAKYPVAKRATATVSATMTEIKNTIDRLLANENGLDGITGFVGGRTFAVTDAARRAEADLKQLKNLAFVQGLTELRNASSTGAGVGNVSNKEGDRFENLKASLEQTQSLSDLKDSLKRLRSQSTSTRDTVNQAFEDTYAYRANAPAAAAKPSGGAPPPPPGFKQDQ